MATFNGSSIDDVFVGTADPDLAHGNGGNDSLYGLGGNDMLDGGEGNDSLEGGENDDKLIGGAGLDSLNGGNGNDTLHSHVPDPLFGGYHTSPGVSYDVAAQADTLTGGAGNDYLFAGFGDTVDGGADDFTGDRLYISFQGASAGVSADFRLLANGPVTIGSGTISNVEYVDFIEGSNFGDLLASYGSYYPYATRIYGRGGDDHIITHYYAGFAGGGAWGGDGNDTIDASASQYGPALYGEAGDDVLIGGTGGRLDGGEGNDTIRGGYSWDSLYGGSGDDVIDAGSSQDWVFGEDGNDILYGGGNDDDIDGGAGDDLIYGDFSPNGTYDAYFPASRADRIKGGTGNDTIYGDDGDDQIDGGADADKLYGGAGNDSLTGGTGNDRLEGGDGDDTFYGGDGADTILAGPGNDSLSGEAGDDILFLGGNLTADDLVLGGPGVDTMVIQGDYAGGLILTAAVNGIENISILASSNTNFGDPGTNLYDYSITTHDSNFAAGLQVRVNGAALLEGEDFTFDGSAETDAKFVVYGGRGVDTLTGGLGHDIFFFAEDRFSTGDVVNGGAGYDGMFLRGNYTIDFDAPGYTGLFTNIENLTLTSATDERYARGGGTEFDYNLILSDAIVKPGETLTVSGALLMASETMILDASQETDGFLRLFGGKAGDTLKGGANADLIHGNLGADTLAGNGGADTFRYDSVAESNASSLDHILDFASGTDKIDLSRVDANALAAGDQAFAWIGSAAFSGAAGQLRAYENSGSWFVEGDTNGDGVADLVIQLTVTAGPPVQSDFLL